VQSQVGSKNKILFWKNKWIGETLLVEKFIHELGQQEMNNRKVWEVEGR